MGGGKALVNAYYRSAERLGVQVRYNTPVHALELHDGEFVAALAGSRRITAKACVLAAGGFESNREWLREARGENARGEWPADNFLIRGTRLTGRITQIYDGCRRGYHWRSVPVALRSD